MDRVGVGSTIAEWHLRIRPSWEEPNESQRFRARFCRRVTRYQYGRVRAGDTSGPGPPQTPTTTKPPTTQAGAAAQTVTVIGCVQREEDYRKANNLGRGGPAGSGVGAGNEFVLANAMMAPSSGGGAAAPRAPTGTGGAASSTVYEIRGPNEGQLTTHVGRRVEIVGMLKPAETGAAGATGGPTAGAPPRGVDVASQDLKLRELEVTSVRPATGTCPS